MILLGHQWTQRERRKVQTEERDKEEGVDGDEDDGVPSYNALGEGIAGRHGGFQIFRWKN